MQTKDRTMVALELLHISYYQQGQPATKMEPIGFAFPKIIPSSTDSYLESADYDNGLSVCKGQEWWGIDVWQQ